MNLVAIFVDANNEGLYAVRYNLYDSDEFERNLDNWDDINFVAS